MNRRLTLLLAGCCLVCLLVVASTLPAADPRLDAPGAADGSTADGTSGQAAAPAETENSTDGPTTPDSDPTTPDNERHIRVPRPVDPGDDELVILDTDGDVAGVPIEVDGERIGETNRSGELVITPPYREEMTITAVGAGESNENLSRTVSLQTDAQIVADDPAIIGQEITLNASVGDTRLPGAAVYRNGERVATTDQSGTAVLEPRERPGETDLRVERGPVTGERTVVAPEPSVSLASPLLFPGSFASVSVTADGQPVPNATVLANGDEVATTGADGTAQIQLPLTNDVTVTTEVGETTQTTSASGLYLRLTAVVVLIPGLIIGLIWAGGRFLAALDIEFEEQSDTPATGGNPFILLGAALAGLAATIDDLFEAIGDAVATLFRAPEGGGFSWPSMPGGGLSLSLPTLSVPSLERLRSSLSRSSGSGSEQFTPPASGAELDAVLDEERELSGERAELRAIWDAFLDHLGTDERETRTAGEIARHALAVGFPARSVRNLLAEFRQVEYGDHEPSTDRIARARAALLDLRDNDPREESE